MVFAGKTFTKLFTRLLLDCLMVFVLAGIPAGATEFRSENFDIPEGELLDEDLIFAGEKCDVAGDLNGDALFFAAQLGIYGDIDGAVMVFARNASIDGDIGNSLAVGAEDIVVSGGVERSAYLFGNTVDLKEEAQFQRDVFAFCERVYISSQITGDLVVHAKRLDFDGVVHGDVKLNCEEVEIRNGALISGDLIIKGCRDPHIDSSVTILGELIHDPSAEESEDADAFSFGAAIYLFLAILIFGMIAALLARNHYVRSAFGAIEDPAKAIAYGILVFFGGWIIWVFLLVTIVGIPAAAILWIALVCFFLFFGQVYIAGSIGALIIKPRESVTTPFWILRMALGLAALFIVWMIPYVGWILYFFAGIVGLGSFVLGAIQRNQNSILDRQSQSPQTN